VTVGRVQSIAAAIFAAVLIVTSQGFDSLGGDCGDGTAGFECNTAAYVLMGAGALACLGLAAVGLWAGFAWLTTRRERQGD